MKALLHLVSFEEFEKKSIRNRSGHINGFDYRFHGEGCRLEKEGIVCEFDFMPTNEYRIRWLKTEHLSN